MGRADYYKEGDWNVICDTCGQKHKASKLKKQWDGIYACPKCFDTRHPQEFVRSKADDQTVPFSRPDTPPEFIEDN